MAPDNTGTVKSPDEPVRDFAMDNALDYAEDVIRVWRNLQGADRGNSENSKHLWSLALTIVVQSRQRP